MRAKVHKSKEFYAAESAYRRDNPTKGDVWKKGRSISLCVVLSVAANFVVITRNKKLLNDGKWIWDVMRPELLPRSEFEEMLESAAVVDNYDTSAVLEYEHGSR